MGIDKYQTINFTPWLNKFLNFNIWSRRNFIPMIGLSHRFRVDKKERSKKKGKKYEQADLDIIIDELLDFWKNPVDIKDSSESPPIDAKCRVCLLFTSSDLKAIPKLNQQKSSPALIYRCLYIMFS